MAGMPEPMPVIANHLRAVAEGAPPPPVPSGLPDELGSILEALNEAIATAG
jgi:hypothetical protein